MLKLKGRYVDRVRDRRGELVVCRPQRANTVVYRALDLVAGLLRSQRDLDGILYWAVGSGDPDWDQSPPTPDRRRTGLVNEVDRKLLDPARDLSYDPATHTLTATISFGAGEGVGTLREFGLFGGDASARPGSGYLVNHAVHPGIEKAEDQVLERELRLTLSAEGVAEPALHLIAGLLINQPDLQGIRYWAVGSGDEAWDTDLPEPDPLATGLTNEFYRKPLNPTLDLDYDNSTRTLVVRSRFAYDEAVGTLREFGLFGGGASATGGSGLLITQQVHPAIDKTRPLELRREFRLALGPLAAVTVPDVVGLQLTAAQAALEAADLALGTVSEELADGPAGQVLAQHPAAGDLAVEGAQVQLTVISSRRLAVPDVVGLTTEEARGVLEDAGLVLDDQATTVEESTARPDTILGQDPLAGAVVLEGTVVRLLLATPVTTLVPDLVRLTPGAAVVILEGSHLRLAPPPYPIEEQPEPYDRVVSQEPAAGSRVQTGTAVTITVSAPWAIEVPDLAGMDVTAAADALRQAALPLLQQLERPTDPPGLALGGQSEVEGEAEVGSIVGQSPAAGQRANLYGTVDIQVAKPVTVSVPRLHGLTEDTARQQLEEVGLFLRRVQSRPDIGPAGTVIEQSPKAGARVGRGSAVTLVLAEAILVRVPDLVRRTLAYAEETVESRGLVLAEPLFQVSDQPVDTVLDQVPAAGESAALNAPVQITLAARVPNVVGLTLDAAQDALQAVGLDLALPPAEEESDEPPGTILSQQPEPGAVAEPGTTVFVSVAIARQVVISGIQPNSARRGTTVEGRLLGRNLTLAEEVVFLRDAQPDPRVQATILDSADRQLPLSIRVLGNAAFGARIVAVQTAAGMVEGPDSVLFTVERPPDSLIESMDVIDDFTLMVRLSRTVADFPNQLTNQGPFALLSPEALEALGEEIGRQPVGTGPFIFSDWAEGEAVHLKRNREHWQRLDTPVEEVLFRFMPPGLEADPAGELQFIMDALMSGEFDIVETRNRAAAQEARSAGFDIQQAAEFYRDKDVFLISRGLQGRFLSPGGLHLETLFNPQSPQRLTYLCHGEPLTLDPLQTNDTASLRVATQILEGLTGFQPGSQRLRPRLAEEWGSSDSGLEWQFQLRPEVFFHDGLMLTAEAVVRNWKRQLA